MTRILFAECTTADAVYDAAAIAEAFPTAVEADGALLHEIPERLERFHYDLIATTTFHADEAQAYSVGLGIPVIAMIVGPGYMELVHEIAALPPGAAVGLVCASETGTDNIAETLRLAGATGVEIVRAVIGSDEGLQHIDDVADLILLSREAIALGLDDRFSRPERVRAWKYEFDPSGLELLRRAIERVQDERPAADRLDERPTLLPTSIGTVR